MLFFQGVRASTVDACEHHNPCQNGGICISTDGGPICECSYIDFDGSYCEQSKLTSYYCISLQNGLPKIYMLTLGFRSEISQKQMKCYKMI